MLIISKQTPYQIVLKTIVFVGNEFSMYIWLASCLVFLCRRRKVGAKREGVTMLTRGFQISNFETLSNPVCGVMTKF